MSADEKDRRRVVSARPGRQAYEVGYAKPPAGSRFQPGRSGNPKGRPRGAKNRAPAPALHEERLKAIVLQEAYRSISVNDANGPMAIPMAQAIIRSVAVNAVKGHQRAQRLFTELLGSTEGANKRLHDEWMDAALTYKLEWERELERWQRLGISGPEPLPHPDHINVDVRAGTARIRGPATKEEKVEWDLWVDRKRMFVEELRELEALRDSPQCRNRSSVLDEIESTKKVLEIIGQAVP